MIAVAHPPQKSRRQHGVRYTSRENILRVIGDLFLDELKAACLDAPNDPQTLEALHQRIGRLTILDPACGGGDFLVVILEELQQLETALLSRKSGLGQPLESRVGPAAFHGFEIDPEAADLTSRRLIESCRNYQAQLHEQFGDKILLSPVDFPGVVTGNALQLDWEKALPGGVDHIVGNPPYIARQNRTPQQNADMKRVFPPGTRTGLLDYAAAWFLKSAEYMQARNTRAAFVVTNSITQGEQVRPLWSLLNERGIYIHFARRTFRWASDPAHRAGVSVVIIGFAASRPNGPCKLYYPADNAWECREADGITPYLTGGGHDTLLPARVSPLCSSTPPARFGGMPNDGGFLLLDDTEKNMMISQSPDSAEFIRPLISVREYFTGQKRWCLWLEERGWEAIPWICERVKAVRQYRLSSRRQTTIALAQSPHRFGEIRQPQGRFVLIPLTSSEHRPYIPMDLLPPGAVVNNTVSFVDRAGPFHFGVLTSRMHMDWTDQVCGRLEGRYRYSTRIVYNNFPWPEATAERHTAVETAANRLLALRQDLLDTGRTLAEIYHPRTLPEKLKTAHHAVDEAVDRCYRPAPFGDTPDRLAFLFQRYREYACPG